MRAPTGRKIRIVVQLSYLGQQLLAGSGSGGGGGDVDDGGGEARSHCV